MALRSALILSFFKVQEARHNREDEFLKKTLQEYDEVLAK